MTLCCFVCSKFNIQSKQVKMWFSVKKQKQKKQKNQKKLSQIWHYICCRNWLTGRIRCFILKIPVWTQSIYRYSTTCWVEFIGENFISMKAYPLNTTMSLYINTMVEYMQLSHVITGDGRSHQRKCFSTFLFLKHLWLQGFSSIINEAQSRDVFLNI